MIATWHMHVPATDLAVCQKDLLEREIKIGHHDVDEALRVTVSYGTSLL